jgi:hypothetical protein
MLPFGLTIPATVPQGSEIPEGLMNNRVYKILLIHMCCAFAGLCNKLHKMHGTYIRIKKKSLLMTAHVPCPPGEVEVSISDI